MEGLPTINSPKQLPASALDDVAPPAKKQKNTGRPGKECQRNGRKKRRSAKRCAAAIAAKDEKLATTQATVADLTFELAQAKEDLDGMAGEREEAFGDRDDLIKQRDALLLEVEVQKLAAQVARQFLAEAAPGIGDYKLLAFGNEHEAHAAEVKAKAKHDESVAQESDGYEELAPGTACLLNDVFVLANLRNDGYLSDKDTADLLAMLQRVAHLMQPLRRSSIKESGKTFGMGATQKYHKNGGRAFQSFLLKLGKFRTEHGDTVEEADPELHCVITFFAQRFEQILFSIFPAAAFNRQQLSAAAGVPVFLQTGTTCMFDTWNYTTAAHVDDNDNGCCMTLAVFIEQHEPGCQRTLCAHRWRFFCPELKRFISVCHGTIVVWNSAVLLHGTTVHSTPLVGGCKSTRWAIVSQVKRSHVQ